MLNRSTDAVPWPVTARFFELSTPWLTLLGECRQRGPTSLTYWRVEKADSVIVLPLQGDRILLPAAQYRPGVEQGTLDFPGGRCPAEADRTVVAAAILQRELGATATALTPLNTTGWAVNSSFSNQRLYGFVATLPPTLPSDSAVAQTYPTTPSGIATLLGMLTCLQCRALLLEWVCRQGIVLDGPELEPGQGFQPSSGQDTTRYSQ